MIRFRVVPRRPRWLDASLVSVETTVALVAAHVAAGGMLPATSWIVVMAATVFAAGLLVLRGNAPTAVVAPCLVAVQLGLHCWLAVLPTGGHLHGAAAHPVINPEMASGHGAHCGLSVQMVAAHIAAGLLATWALALRRRAVDVLLTWGSPTFRVPAGPVLRTCSPSDVLCPRERLLHTSPRRGPPRVSVA